ncbi:TetR/AcrR family transcriptional regulator [Algicola sagamiensis]|uniref:TetR/AcrR family transcriptional regulator n=1 Tax=Algicola sagamiensis TaxID=163869 RepID=UPI00036B7EBD|nr:TetR/AcrR family transcriptional regulator [Algicola sagamiensis]
MKDINPTAAKIADLAEQLIQERGFNGFSFRDLQDELGIKTASIHYHYKTKQDLAVVVFERYLARYQASLEEIAIRECSAKEKLIALADIFISVRRSNKLCLCGMYASDFYSLTDHLQHALQTFVNLNEHWVALQVSDGIEQGEFETRIPAEQAARLYFNALEGSMLLSRFQDADYIQQAASDFFLVVFNEII